ncbi:ATP-grasp domain-containing protein [Streptomyces sp. TS71-3]|uniref:ATP-grasp domain-containing protein n=1 Tax=Streptomyces sp. TS71-3 TaxID=2733862 RepID=UPI001B146C3E|nr:ATP-grasp domain-containing protein [Streptomyces sp. TS71-3]GHJ37201.1 carboxylase [Streptomyces sp. TS71-3]
MTTVRQPALVIMTSLKMIIRNLRLVEYAKESGVTPVLLFTQGGDEKRLRELMADPGHPLSALGDLCPVADPSPASTIAGVQPVLRRYDVQGVLSCGEYYVEAAGVLAHLLGLPGSGWPAAAVSRNKMFQRTALPDLSPRWQAIHPGDRDGLDLSADAWPGPVVLKPVSRMSSSGVRALDSVDEVAGAVAGYPEHETLLVEERVSGPEYSVESLVQGGEPIWSGITEKLTNETGGPTFTEMRHTVPAPEPAPGHFAELSRVHAEVLRRLGFRDGIAHAEYRVTEDRVVLMEVAFRIPGDGISALWGLATGGSVEERLVDLALGRPTSYPEARRRVRHLFLDHPHGTLVDIRSKGAEVSWTTSDERWPELPPAEPGAAPRCCAVMTPRVPGDRLGPIVDSGERSVSVIVDAPLDADIDAVAERAAEDVEIITS